jgi:hypothetical protein
MSDSYFLRPHPGGPALEMRPGVSGRVLLSTAHDVSEPHVVLDPGQVEEVCRVMYRYAGLEWPELTMDDAPCTTRFREGECAGKMGHPGACSVWGDGIPGDWWRGVATPAEQTPPADLAGHPEECHGEACYAAPHRSRADGRLGDIVNLLNEIRDRLPAPPSPVCGADNSAHSGDLNCELPAGHEGRHAADNASWPVLHIPLRHPPTGM